MKLTRVLGILGGAIFLSAMAYANEGAAAGPGMFGPIGAGLAIGLAACGGALGQGRAVAAALDGMARNPDAKLFVPMIIGLALIESLVIYALIIAFKF